MVHVSTGLPPLVQVHHLGAGLHTQRDGNRRYNTISRATRWVLLHVGVDAGGLCRDVAEQRASHGKGSPVDTEAEPIVWRNVCGVTPGKSVLAITLAQKRFVPW
jgi:hypothetical protein